MVASLLTQLRNVVAVSDGSGQFTALVVQLKQHFLSTSREIETILCHEFNNEQFWFVYVFIFFFYALVLLCLAFLG